MVGMPVTAAAVAADSDASDSGVFTAAGGPVNTLLSKRRVHVGLHGVCIRSEAELETYLARGASIARRIA